MGDWLRDFTPSGLENTNQFLTRQAFTAREQLAPGVAPIIDMDSTCHEQEGQKMEGLEWNYAGKWGLDSLVAFDELGLCYGMQLRPGSTFSAQGAGKMIERYRALGVKAPQGLVIVRTVPLIC